MAALSSKQRGVPATEAVTDELWYKDAIIYQLHVKAFADSNNDGIGDFAGLTEKLGYLQDLGVTTLWLLPFYPSPGRDDGYDIADYGDINPDFGTMKDFRRFIQEAKKRGLRVITELVINHTSDQHDWFKRARRSDPNSSARNWYVWSDTDQKYQGTRIIFTDTEKSNWTWDPEAGQFYWHRFFSHQPDLNFDNPRVVSALVQVMKRWLDTGVDGFRLDAIPYLCERDGTNNENLPETHAIIKGLRRELDAYAKGKVLLAEANQWPEDVQEYFGRGDECHMAYHFPLMPRIYMAIAQEDRFPITDILRQTPDIPGNCQWALFLRNHDELTLEMVTDVERDYLWSTYANDPRARINVGIRRRLAPLMDNDRRKIELMNSLLLSFPGTPIIYYGDEIGMGDNIYLGDRNGVRTPMQWTPDRNGGFSRADPARLYAPTIMDPVYGYEAVNVEAQSRSLSSLLSATKRLIAVRKSTLAFGRGTMTFIRPENRSVLCYVRQYQGEVILCVANLSRSAQATELDLSAFKDRIPLEMLGRTRFPPIGELPYMITLAPYGFYWFELQERDKSAPVVQRAVPEFETLVVPLNATWVSLARERGVFERDVLPGHLARSRWYPERSPKAIRPTLTSAIPFCDIGDNRPWLAFFETTQRGVTTRYVLPMQIEWVRFDRERYNPHALAAVRQGAREGTLLDVATDQIFIALLLRNLQQSLTVDESEQGLRLEFRPTNRFSDKPIRQPEHIRTVESEPAPQHRAGGQRLCRQDLPDASARPQSRDRDGALPHRCRQLCQHAGAARQRRTGRGQREERGRRRSRLRRQSGRPLDRECGLSRSLRRGAAPAGGEHAPRRARGRDPLSALHVAGRAARGRAACCARRQQRACRIRAGACRPRRRAALDRRSDAVRRPRFRCAPAAAGNAEGSRPPAGRPGAGVAAGPAGFAGNAAAARGRRRQHPLPWRPRSHSVADRQGRHLHRRLRRRAAAQYRRTPAQGARGARHRQPGPIDRLFGNRSP